MDLITDKDQALGVIGLLAFDQEQRRRLFENTEGILTFLNKMADLLSSKLHEHDMIRQLTRSSEKMDKIMNLFNQGIIVINERGCHQEINFKAKMLLGIDDRSSLPIQVEKLLRDIVQKSGEFSQTISLTIRKQEKTLFIIKQKLAGVEPYSEYLISIQDVNEIRNLAEKATEEQKKPFGQIIGVSPSILEVKEYAFKVSQSNSLQF